MTKPPLVAAVLALASLFCSFTAIAADGEKPNVLLAYCSQAVCAPSRFSLMSGSHSTSTGLYGPGSDLRTTRPDAVTLPRHFFKHGGHRTESPGKVIHIGHGNEGDPASFSAPHWKDKEIATQKNPKLRLL